MKLRYCSEYNDFTMFLTHFMVGAEAVVFDKDVQESLLCKIVDISETDNAKGAYEAKFIIPDGIFSVGVDVIRSETQPNEFYPAIKEFHEDQRAIYC